MYLTFNKQLLASLCLSLLGKSTSTQVLGGTKKRRSTLPVLITTQAISKGLQLLNCCVVSEMYLFYLNSLCFILFIYNENKTLCGKMRF